MTEGGKEKERGREGAGSRERERERETFRRRRLEVAKKVRGKGNTARKGTERG